MIRGLKEHIRISLGLIQESRGNFQPLEKLTSMVLKKFIALAPHRLWPRNSFTFGCHIPILSDLDLTLTGNSTQEAINLLKRKKKFILIGEINFYHDQIRNELLFMGNPLELRRDPRLIFQEDIAGESTEAQKIVFILRQIHSDMKWLLSYPQVRIKKWRYLLELLDSSPRKNLRFSQLFSLIHFLDIRKDAQRLFALSTLPSTFYSLAYLWPQGIIWDLAADEVKREINGLSELKREILLEQVRWEFWGVGCHYYWLGSKVSSEHLQRMLELAQASQETSDRLRAMQNIISFIKQEDCPSIP
jgi:hypothetical protein